VAYNWTKLFDLLMSLKSSGPFQFLFLNHETALINALMSGTIPLRGKKDYQFEFCRIESLLSPESKILPLSNRVTSYRRSQTILSSHTSFLSEVKFENVEADMNALQTWLAENALENKVVVPTSVARHPSKATVEKLRDYLSKQQNEPIRTKKELFEDLKAGNILELGNRCANLSKRAFNRIWTDDAPAAWTKAGFRPGRSRKNKSPR
jgi:hypothetical protein